MSNETKINGSISCSPSSTKKVHDLTMLYLQGQDLSKLSISEIAQKYSDIEAEFNEAFRTQRTNKINAQFL